MILFDPDGIRVPLPRGAWRLWQVRSLLDGRPLLKALRGEMETLGYSRQDCFAVRIALEEAIVNAVKHGHRGNLSKSVQVRYRVDTNEVELEVVDEGAGFDPGAVPDPLAAENLDGLQGGGLFLMRTYMSSVQFNERGNGVRLRRRRSPS